jgi:hypothetical protein
VYGAQVSIGNFQWENRAELVLCQFPAWSAIRRGHHLVTANMDAANRAEELLTAEQRQRLISEGAHVMTPAQMQ